MAEHEGEATHIENFRGGKIDHGKGKGNSYHR